MQCINSHAAGTARHWIEDNNSPGRACFLLQSALRDHLVAAAYTQSMQLELKLFSDAPPHDWIGNTCRND